MIQQSKYVTVLTGAGISTSAGIPDFRGPKGIWTLEENEKKRRRLKKRRDVLESSNANGPSKIGDTIDIPKRKRNSSNNNSSSSSKKRKAETIKPNITDTKVTTSDKTKRPRGDDIQSSENSTTDTPTIKTQHISFETAKPTITHRAITKLVEIGKIKYCITQNVDGLHRRSGLPRNKNAILHGCIFTEKCEKCHKEYFRDFDVGGLSFQKTGRRCSIKKCKGYLRDTILDWEDELPDEDWGKSQEECAKSDLCICLGTSLRIEPAGSLPKFAKKFVIVNKQVTPYDVDASLVIHAPVDDILIQIIRGLNIDIPEEDVN